MIPFHVLLIVLQLIAGNGLNSEWGYVLFFAGIFFWTLAEYILHRWLFHWVSESAVIKAFHFAMHGYHHQEPRDTTRLYMPPIPAFLFLSVFWVIFSLFFGSEVWLFLPGFELGYLIYSTIHFLVHTIEAPKRFSWLWRHHLIHHYKEPSRAFGVSSRFWDRIFHTMPDQNK